MRRRIWNVRVQRVNRNAQLAIRFAIAIAIHRWLLPISVMISVVIVFSTRVLTCKRAGTRAMPTMLALRVGRPVHRAQRDQRQQRSQQQDGTRRSHRR